MDNGDYGHFNRGVLPRRQLNKELVNDNKI